MRQLSLRSRLTLFVVVGALIGIAGLVLGFNLLLRSSLDSDIDRVLEARASAAVDSVSVESGRIAAAESPDEDAPDAQTWIYRGGRAIERAPGPPELQRLADSLAGGSSTFLDAEGLDVRLLSVPIDESVEQRGTVVAALSVEPYEVTVQRAQTGSIAIGAILLAVIALGTRLLVGRALRPVAQMTAEARRWSEHDLSHRFNAGKPHDELTTLAATFDAMLERVAAALRNEQRFTAELSHELRTPLAAVIAECELALRRERPAPELRDALSAIARRAAALQESFDSLLLAATSRSGVIERSSVADAVASATAGLAGVIADRGIDLVQVGSHEVEVAANAAAVERAVSPLIENACRYGRSTVRIAVDRRGDEVRIAIDDDGPGVEPGEIDRIFEPGVRGKRGPAASAGAGLGLSLSRRLTRAIGGDVIAVASERGGRFELRIPATVPSDGLEQGTPRPRRPTAPTTSDSSGGSGSR